MNVWLFSKDKWIETSASGLDKGDLIYYKGDLIELVSKASVVDDKVHLPARSYQVTNEPIVIAAGEQWRNRKSTLMVMDLTNSDCRDFADGTYMIAELEMGPGAVYSPRLTSDQLEEWCSVNLSRFKGLYTENEAALERGDTIKIKPWW